MSKIIHSDAAGTHVATLVTNPENPCLNVTMLEAVRDVLSEPGAAEWLNIDIAADLFFSLSARNTIGALRERVKQALNGAPVDLIIQPVLRRRKLLFLADMDSTMIGQECIDELAGFAGFKAEVAAITERAMRGELAFEPALRERVAVLKGLPVTIVDEIIREHLSLTPGGKTLVSTLKRNGAYTCLVSGGFTLFTTRIAALIGFDMERANRLLVENGRFSGLVAEPILGREAKLATLLELRERFELESQDTLAIGDGANDLAMLEAAGLGVAYRAKPAVAAAAAAEINHSDLTALLYAQGYHASEFVN